MMIETGVQVRGRFEDAMVLVLNSKEEVTNQGKQVASKSQKRQGNIFFQRASRGNAALLIFCF